MTWRKLQDEIPVDYVFYPQQRRRRGDVIPAVTDALIRYIEGRPEYVDTDVVYSHWLWPGGTAALALRDRFSWPVAAIARGSEMHAWQPVHPHCRAYVDQTLSKADLVLANCEALRQLADSIVPGSLERVRVLYNGCDATRFRPAESKASARARVRFSRGLNYFVCCATVVERKGMRDLASAWRTFRAHHRSWRLVVIGPIVSKELAACLYAAGRGTISLVGRVDAERVLPYLQAADAYVQPSLNEGLANATMEAMATAVPTISTDAGGQRELVRNGYNGWLVPTGDANALSAAMTELADDRDRARLFAQRGRETVVDRFDPVVHTAQLSEMLTELHARKSSLVAR
jgi:glycosyltransferase involved in cell wall biosynthesis